MRLAGIGTEKRQRKERIYAGETEILQSVACDRPLSEILEGLTRKIEQWYEGMRCALLLFDRESNRFVRAVAPSFPKALRAKLQKMSLEETLQDGGAASLAGPLLSFNLVRDPAWADLRHIAAQHGLHPRCSQAIVSVTGDLLGILSMFSRSGEAVGLLNLALFEKARDIASIAIERSRLNKELRKLSELVIEAQEAERRRIARDLHDSVNQLLSSAAFRISMIDALVAEQDREIKEELERVKLLLTKGIDEIHRISDDLRPSELDAFGLVPAVRSLCREFQRKTNLGLKFECESSSKRLSDAVELTLYRIIQEALNNIEKHSGASQASLRLQWDGASIKLAVRDNGKGLESVSERLKQPKKAGMGLLNMRERTAFLGGSFSIRSRRGKGTDITVKIPLGGNDPTVETTL
jgi:signal transduction histidine kinase